MHITYQRALGHIDHDFTSDTATMLVYITGWLSWFTHPLAVSLHFLAPFAYVEDVSSLMFPRCGPLILIVG